jgi:predicted nucleic acid-binding Zn ribbon protein
MKHKGTNTLKVKKCLYCNNPTYGMNKYCSKKCKAKMKKLKRKTKMYYDTETQQWEILK